MQHLKIGDVVTINNRDYTIALTTKKNNYNYVYLATIEEPYDVMFAKVILHDSTFDLEVVYKKEEKEELLELFKQDLTKIEI